MRISTTRDQRIVSVEVAAVAGANPLMLLFLVEGEGKLPSSIFAHIPRQASAVRKASPTKSWMGCLRLEQSFHSRGVASSLSAIRRPIPRAGPTAAAQRVSVPRNTAAVPRLPSTVMCLILRELPISRASA